MTTMRRRITINLELQPDGGGGEAMWDVEGWDPTAVTVHSVKPQLQKLRSRPSRGQPDEASRVVPRLVRPVTAG